MACDTENGLWTRHCVQVIHKRACEFFVNHQEFEMEKLMQASKWFWQDESGVTAIEYGLIAALIAVAIIGTVTTIGQDLVTRFTAVANAL